MCIGAFEGVVKKVVKRGRPRKQRPEHEERVDKAQRTRSRNIKKAAAAEAGNSQNTSSESRSSSASEYSESSYGMSPPPAEYSAPFTDFSQSPYTQADPFVGSADVNADLGYVLQPVHEMQETCVSPQDIQNAPSPSHSHAHSQSHHSHHSQQHSAVPSPTLSAHSIHSIHSPPDLCTAFSASSPTASLSFYDLPSADADEMFLDEFGKEASGAGVSSSFLEGFGGESLGEELGMGMGMMGGKEFEAFPVDGDVGELFGEGEVGGWVN
jgi:regulatory protein SWI5